MKDYLNLCHKLINNIRSKIFLVHNLINIDFHICNLYKEDNIEIDIRKVRWGHELDRAG